MNCQNFESIVNDLVRDQIMEATVQEQALHHGTSCASCSLRLQEEQALTEGLRELKVQMQDAVASDAVEARLALEFRNYRAAAKRVGGEVAPVVVSGGRSNRQNWAYAAAAGILLAVAFGITANRFWPVGVGSDGVERSGNNGSAWSYQVANTPGSDLLNPRREPVGETSVTVDSPMREVAPVETPIERTSQDTFRRPARPRTTSRNRIARSTVTVQSLNIIAPDPEVTTDFIALAYWNESNVSEAGQVVRLELPRYAMARFGVPINEERYDERVKADVWLGADGLARAIRFVQ